MRAAARTAQRVSTCALIILRCPSPSREQFYAGEGEDAIIAM
jgi:hypothetical protein